ncbi:MAG: serine/threonine protein kinase, partial [Pseudonocardiales bacterium]|nr:serine/threonine protein kinase [Pseudonocardiales bacterium]
MGVVWEATDEKLRRTVAIKELLAVVEPRLDPDGRSFDEARDRIQREARIAARLQHPNVISVYDVALHDDRPWLVMEYLPSRSLDTVLAERGPLPPREVAEIGRQAAAGLAAAHGVGVVHRDIKPGNVLLADNGNVKIVDFGVSRAADEVQLTRTGLIAGTPAYLAPEVARGQTPTPASDVFALGATLYAAVEGEPPFGLSDNAYALLHTVAGGNVRPPTNAGPLTAVLMRLLRADPAERPTAQAAQNELTVVADRAPMTGAHSDREATVPVAPAQEAQAQEATVAVAGPVAA